MIGYSIQHLVEEGFKDPPESNLESHQTPLTTITASKKVNQRTSWLRRAPATSFWRANHSKCSIEIIKEAICRKGEKIGTIRKSRMIHIGLWEDRPWGVFNQEIFFRILFLRITLVIFTGPRAQRMTHP